MYNKLVHKETRLALVGLGYVGLPIALEFAKKISVIGFDINEERLTMMRQGIDPCKELDSEAFENADIEFTSSIDELRKASFFIVAVPTPIDDHNQPDLTPLLGATRSVAKALKKGDYVVYESTVYPGCTEEDCIPVLEEISGLKAGVDFKFGYSPERINPGEKVHTLPNTIKIVSGCDPEALDTIAKVYELVVKPGVHRAPNVKVAEAAKIIENTQRDVNIALMNELSIIFSRIGINTYDVLEAAGTKWNFLKFYPGSPAERMVERIVGRPELPIRAIREEEGAVTRLLQKLCRMEEGKSAWYPYEVLTTLCQLWLAFSQTVSIPERPPRGSAAEERVEVFLRYIAQHYSSEVTLDALAASASVSKSECLRCFKTVLRSTPYRYLTEYRLAKAAERLRQTDEPISVIAAEVGFDHLSHFGKRFREKTGMSPREYRKRQTEGAEKARKAAEI